VGDTTPPSTPTNFAVRNFNGNSIAVAWKASTDNVAVAGYRLYRDSVLVGTRTNTNYKFSRLSCGHSYTFAVEAFDAAGNVSGQATLTASTRRC
jgi:chitodextrinase